MSEKKLSIFISRILRHQPEIANVRIDEHGWANVDELITGINGTGRKIDKVLLEKIVREDSKQRYSFNEEKTKIRANQGHSIYVDVGLKEQEPPEYLYHGTSDRFLESIKQQGLRKMNRLYVHLSKDIETALIVGKRHGGNPVVLKIYSKDMYQDGNMFYLSENGVWLTEKVDIKYMRIKE